MKKLVMSALMLGALAQATGCIFVSDDSSSSGTAEVDVTWSLLNDQAVGTCPTSDAAATIYAQRASDSSPFTDIFNCVDGGGAAMDLPAGDYEIWVDITSADGSILYAESESVSITLADGELDTADFLIDVANGFFDVGWNITDNAGNTVGCAGAAGNDGVSILSTLAGTQDGVDSIFDCVDGEGQQVTTDAVPIGDIVVSASILTPDANNPGQDVAIGAAPDVTTSIDYGNQYVNLGTLDIALF